MEKKCKNCKKFFECDLKSLIPNPDYGCFGFVSVKRCNFVALEQNLNTKNWVILGFSDSRKELTDIISSRSGFEKNYFRYLVINNIEPTPYELYEIKDKCLLNICENVAFALSRAEYHMLKHRYTKSKSCFDLSFKHISAACTILENF